MSVLCARFKKVSVLASPSVLGFATPGQMKPAAMMELRSGELEHLVSDSLKRQREKTSALDGGYLFYFVLRIEHRASHSLSICPITELCPLPRLRGFISSCYV